MLATTRRQRAAGSNSVGQYDVPGTIARCWPPGLTRSPGRHHSASATNLDWRGPHGAIANASLHVFWRQEGLFRDQIGRGDDYSTSKSYRLEGPSSAARYLHVRCGDTSFNTAKACPTVPQVSPTDLVSLVPPSRSSLPPTQSLRTVRQAGQDLGVWSCHLATKFQDTPYCHTSCLWTVSPLICLSVFPPVPVPPVPPSLCLTPSFLAVPVPPVTLSHRLTRLSL